MKIWIFRLGYKTTGTVNGIRKRSITFMPGYRLTNDELVKAFPPRVIRHLKDTGCIELVEEIINA